MLIKKNVLFSEILETSAQDNWIFLLISSIATKQVKSKTHNFDAS